MPIPDEKEGAVASGAERVTILAGRLLDVVAGVTLTDQAIVIADGRVESVAARTDVVAGTRTVDLTGLFVLPGLIDCHTHITEESYPKRVLALGSSAARDALVGLHNARRTLEAGFTTVRDCGPFRALTDIALRDAIQEGLVEGPRIVACGAYMSVTAGAADITWVTPDVRERLPLELRFGLADTPDEMRTRVRELLHAGADFIKLNATGAYVAPGTRPDLGEMSEAQIAVAVEEAERYGAHVAAHAHGAGGVKAAVRAGVRSIEHGTMLDDDAIQLMKDAGTYLVPTLWGTEYSLQESLRSASTEGGERERLAMLSPRHRSSFQKALGAGVKLAFGTDSGSMPHALNATEFQLMADLGMPPLDAIRAATIWAADLLRRSADLGSIQPGRHADLIAVRGDPLTNLGLLRAPEFVMKGGHVVSNRGEGA